MGKKSFHLGQRIVTTLNNQLSSFFGSAGHQESTLLFQAAMPQVLFAPLLTHCFVSIQTVGRQTLLLVDGYRRRLKKRSFW